METLRHFIVCLCLETANLVETLSIKYNVNSTHSLFKLAGDCGGGGPIECFLTGAQTTLVQQWNTMCFKP